jgi:S1-C subfamily serine protease
MSARVLLVAIALLGAQPQTTTLHITVTVMDGGRAIPVPRHALLISDNPATSAPQRRLTTLDGTADIQVRPGSYTIESDQPLIFQGKAYQWTQTVDVPAGGVTTLALTTANAQIDAAPAGAKASDANAVNADVSSSAIFIDWQNSLVSIWSPTELGAGFLIDSRGLLLTHQHLVGKAASVEVQLSPTLKVAGRVLAADPARNLAVVWIDPKAVAAIRPVKLGYAVAGKAPLAEKDPIFAISSPVHGPKEMTAGVVSRVNEHTILTDVSPNDDSLGVPLFNAAGDVVAVTVPEDDASSSSSGASRAVRIDEAKSLIADAERKMQGAEAPKATPLPREPEKSLSEDALNDAAKKRPGSLSAYEVPAAGFEVSIITPVLNYAAHNQERAGERTRGRQDRPEPELQPGMRALQDFANWSEYASEYPPVLMIRATPKLVEGKWTTVARGAARTQGVAIPPIKRFKAGFSRLRLFCGAAEVTPIHPFVIQQHLDNANIVSEGFYIFDPGAIGPQCGIVKLMLFSEKEPDKADTRIIDARLVEQIWQDFAAYRSATDRAER